MRKLTWIFLFCLAACAPAIAGPAKPDGASVAPPPALARAWQAQIATGPNLILSLDSSGAVKTTSSGACSGNGNVGTWANLTFQTDSSGNLKICGPTGGGGSGTVTNTGTLAANAIVIGNGGVDVSTTTTGSGVLTALGNTANASGGLTTPNGSATFTNKTYDTAGSGNVFKINGTSITAVSGTGAVCLASGSACGGSATPPTYLSKTGNYTLVAATDFATIGTVELLTNAGTFTLPTAVGIQGQIVCLVNHQTAHDLTVATTSSQTIDGASPGTITNGSLCIASDNANWRSVASLGLAITLTSGGVIYADTTHSVASSALLTANAIVIGGGAGTAPATTTTGSGVVTAIGNAVNASGGLVTTDGSASLSSKTLVQLPTPMTYIAGVSQAGTASVACNLPSSGAASAVSASSTTPPLGVMSFSGSAQNDVHCMGITPADWTSASALDITLFWRAASTSGNVVWSVSTLFAGDGTALSGSYNSASTVTDATKGTTLQVNTATITGVTSTGIGASKLFFLDIGRNGGAGSDTMSGTAELIGFIVTIRRSPVGGS